MLAMGRKRGASRQKLEASAKDCGGNKGVSSWKAGWTLQKSRQARNVHCKKRRATNHKKRKINDDGAFSGLKVSSEPTAEMFLRWKSEYPIDIVEVKEQVQEMKDKYDAEVQTHSKTTTLLGNGEVEKDALQVQKDHMKQPYDAAVISFKEHILELQSDRHVHE